MLFDLFLDTEAEVLKIRAKAKELLAAGTTVMSWSSEGTSVNKQFTLPVSQVLQETADFLKAKNPSKYGYKVTRTVSVFS